MLFKRLKDSHFSLLNKTWCLLKSTMLTIFILFSKENNNFNDCPSFYINQKWWKRQFFSKFLYSKMCLQQTPTTKLVNLMWYRIIKLHCKYHSGWWLKTQFYIWNTTENFFLFVFKKYTEKCTFMTFQLPLANGVTIYRSPLVSILVFMKYFFGI